MFSGGSYDEVARWLRNFLTSHAKRGNARAEVIFEAGDEREDQSYGARVVVGSQTGPPMEFAYREVADNRGNLAWCRSLAERVRASARELAGDAIPTRAE